MSRSPLTGETGKFQAPKTWPLMYWPNQLLSAMMVVGSLGFARERLVETEGPILLKVLIITLIISSFLYFGFLQNMKASVERGTLKSNAYKFLEPVGYILVVSALLAWAYLLSDASYIGSDLIVATGIFYTLLSLHGFLMFQLIRLRMKIPLEKSVT